MSVARPAQGQEAPRGLEQVPGGGHTSAALSSGSQAACLQTPRPWGSWQRPPFRPRIGRLAHGSPREPGASLAGLAQLDAAQVRHAPSQAEGQAWPGAPGEPYRADAQKGPSEGGARNCGSGSQGCSKGKWHLRAERRRDFPGVPRGLLPGGDSAARPLTRDGWAPGRLGPTPPGPKGWATTSSSTCQAAEPRAAPSGSGPTGPGATLAHSRRTLEAGAWLRSQEGSGLQEGGNPGSRGCGASSHSNGPAVRTDCGPRTQARLPQVPLDQRCVPCQWGPRTFRPLHSLLWLSRGLSCFPLDVAVPRPCTLSHSLGHRLRRSPEQGLGYTPSRGQAPHWPGRGCASILGTPN